MTTYLTKKENDKTSHFRATVSAKGVDVTEGVFYNWLSKYYKGCGNEQNAEAECQKLVSEKLQEGYKETTFIETLENSMDVYDKAKWHFQGDFPKELDQFQGYVHTGMFLGWLIDHDFVSDQFKEDNGIEIAQFKNRTLTGAEVFSSCCDGVLLLEDVSEAGNRFGIHYFDFKTGDFLNDYSSTLGDKYSSLYHVEDSWVNYNSLKAVIDQKLFFWQKKNKKPFWKFW